MKKSLLIPLALTASFSSLSAFTLDFTGFFEENGSPDDFTFNDGENGSGAIPVAGFGFLTFIIPTDEPGQRHPSQR